jgi:hypothetical protein
MERARGSGGSFAWQREVPPKFAALVAKGQCFLNGLKLVSLEALGRRTRWPFFSFGRPYRE